MSEKSGNRDRVLAPNIVERNSETTKPNLPSNIGDCWSIYNLNKVMEFTIAFSDEPISDA